MIGIRAVASYVPAGHLLTRDRQAAFQMTDDFIAQKLGVQRVSRKAAEEETSTLCLKAFSALQERVPIAPAEIDCLIVCTQNPDACGIPHTSAFVHGALGAGERCAAFDISLGCSGYVYGLSIAQSFMQANGLTHGLLFTADPYSKIVDPADRDTALLFGDAATVTLLDASADARWVPARFRFATRGADARALHNADGRLHMNGRAVFTFSATAVPEQIRALLADAGIGPEQVDLFLFHQGSKYIVDTLAKRLALPADKVPSNLAEQGNTVSSTLPLLFERHVDDPDLRRVVMSGFGVGLSWASCIVERRS
jgi:3-oxoacyl-[acyl-carrier-protein] synthase-3